MASLLTNKDRKQSLVEVFQLWPLLCQVYSSASLNAKLNQPCWSSSGINLLIYFLS